MHFKILIIVLATQFLTAGHLIAQDKIAPNPAEKYYQLIEAPGAPEKWDSWRNQIRQLRDSVRRHPGYTDDNYQKSEFKWASNAYSTFFLMANEKTLYDRNGNPDIKTCIEKYERNYGGIDVVVLWPTYPQLGFDNRTQFDFYRNLPGGIQGLKKLTAELHAMGKKLMIAYNPWDNIARTKGVKDEDELLKMVAEIQADGVYLDTISIVDGFFDNLQKARKGAIFQSEIPINAQALNQVHQSWLEVGWNEKHKHLEFGEMPHLVRNRWLQQKHMIYRLSRFSHEQSTLLQNAWVNGCGLVIWENVFGTVNPLNARDRFYYKAMLPVLRRYSTFFTEGEWTPLFPVKLNRVYASEWRLGNKTIWTVINRQQQRAVGRLFEIRHEKGMRYFDLITGAEMKTVLEDGKAGIYADYQPKAISGILAVPENECTPEFFAFMKTQAEAFQKADFGTTAVLPEHLLKMVEPTKRYNAKTLPKNMVRVGVPSDSATMTFAFRQRECGFYPIGNYVDYSYSQTRNEITTAKIVVKLAPFAMDRTLVSNAEFAAFLKSSGYQPLHKQNFLKHWTNGRPPKGLEDHPVVYVDLGDARAYAKWAGKRLPTEAEWQWAAQNGAEATVYPWGDKLDSTVVNTGQWSGTTPVEKLAKGRTSAGLYDMSGNVWQMTESERTDGYNNYCILRGGAWYINRASEWYADQGAQKTSFGAKYLMTWPGLDRCATVGFRCVADID
ncbi:SUMF1/EgtB/PvdO family nonheme iron enzyme [Dyadobacter sp. CY261]|uniref:formylglycine-generating enzyme family protein n=1 Tax=Dyadobacter sp. CY261 TaxID=2907203 RepID=UPI001F3CB051|nr:SUMF1/EgtB/PvdO family nonheme iron enzyme [Dyadobacter sp. CY261]MCF0069712.1 SUMF1/EgtB/PvdO family nonheme iron enzyme [Dyadobacter sp. CY261]